LLFFKGVLEAASLFVPALVAVGFTIAYFECEGLTE